jgi:hypothetical protein
MCLECKHCFSSKKTFDKHSCSSAKTNWQIVSAQRFIKNTASPWFAVQPPPIVPSADNVRWSVYQAQQIVQTSATSHQSYSDEFRVLHQFLRRERWLERVENEPHEPLMHIASYSTQDTAYGGLHLHINAFLTCAQLALNEPYIRRAIGKRPAEEQEQLRVRYHRDVNPGTLAHYSRIIAAMISFTHRIVLDVDTPYTFPISDEIVNACKDLFSHFKPSSDYSRNQAGDEHSEDEEVEESSESSGEEEDALPLRLEQSIPLSRVLAQTTSLMQLKLKKLLYLLYTELPTYENRGQFFTPIYHFLVLNSLRKDGGWAAANTITHTIAAILFSGRLVFAWKVFELAEENKTDYSK